MVAIEASELADVGNNPQHIVVKPRPNEHSGSARGNGSADTQPVGPHAQAIPHPDHVIPSLIPHTTKPQVLYLIYINEKYSTFPPFALPHCCMYSCANGFIFTCFS